MSADTTAKRYTNIGGLEHGGYTHVQHGLSNDSTDAD
jgi:hypothetical protein